MEALVELEEIIAASSAMIYRYVWIIKLHALYISQPQ